MIVYWPAQSVPHCADCRKRLVEAREAWRDRNGFYRCTKCLVGGIMAQIRDGYR